MDTIEKNRTQLVWVSAIYLRSNSVMSIPIFHSIFSAKKFDERMSATVPIVFMLKIKIMSVILVIHKSGTVAMNSS